MCGHFYPFALLSLYYKQSARSVDYDPRNSRFCHQKEEDVFQTKFSFSNRLFEPAQVIDMIKGLVVIGSAIPMCFMDISVVYHTVRAQAAIKLYMFFNMLEVSRWIWCERNQWASGFLQVCDRLLSSFGQDTLDAVYWTATEPRRKHSAGKLLLWLIIAIVYCSKSRPLSFKAASDDHLLLAIHAILVLLQAITLNVAFNSQNRMLLIIMLTNNVSILGGVHPSLISILFSI